MSNEMSNPQPAPQSEGTSKDARMYGMLCHLLALAGFIGIPLGNVIGPLVIWMIKKDQYPFVDDQGKESLNFQISLTICAAISGVLTLLLVGWVLLIAVGVYGLVMVIMAAVKANEGVAYRYPLTMRFIK